MRYGLYPPPHPRSTRVLESDWSDVLRSFVHTIQARVPVLSWHGHLLSSGCTDGSIHHHDVRVARHKVGELLGHTAEVCGLTWRSDGQILASGGNDNVVNCWECVGHVELVLQRRPNPC